MFRQLVNPGSSYFHSDLLSDSACLNIEYDSAYRDIFYLTQPNLSWHSDEPPSSAMEERRRDVRAVDSLGHKLFADSSVHVRDLDSDALCITVGATRSLLSYRSSFSFQETCVQLFSALELTFSIDLSAEEGGGNVELLPNGRDLEVTAANVYSYVRKYSHYRSVSVCVTGQASFEAKSQVG